MSESKFKTAKKLIISQMNLSRRYADMIYGLDLMIYPLMKQAVLRYFKASIAKIIGDK